MSEGPQVKLRTEWLRRHLSGRKVITADSSRQDLAMIASTLQGQAVTACFCHGKHIFVEFANRLTLHNHLLMRGKWRREPGQLLFLSPDVWLALYVGPYTVCNIHGQKLEVIPSRQVHDVLKTLGPDVMADPFPEDQVLTALRATSMPISEALLDQRVLSGIGNVARSEILFRAGISPFLAACSLSGPAFNALCESIRFVLTESYAQGGRWTHRVYHNAGRPCPQCGAKVQRVRIPPGRRLTYFCPVCQGVSSK